MGSIDNVIKIYKALGNCTTYDQAQTLKKKLKGSCSRESNARGELLVKKQMKENENSPWEIDEFTVIEQLVGGSSLASVERLGKDVQKLIVEVKELITQGGFHEGLSLEAPEEQALELLTVELVGHTFQINMDQLWQSLTKSKVNTIGVWGMGGVGKTTLLEHIHNKVQRNSSFFGNAYWVTVSKNCSIHKLQNDIAKRLGECPAKDLSNEDDERIRAAILARYLKSSGKFILFLDDMWNYFDLKMVGIPNRRGCKIVLTTRQFSVCQEMDCEEIIKVNPLLGNEAWNLFVEYARFEIPREVEKIAKQVVKECDGLPLGITTLARSMGKSVDIYEWRSVLKKLQSSKVGILAMEEDVFRVLRLSYDRLNDWKLQQCLLYCATYPEDHKIPINDLIWAFIDYRLIDEEECLQDMIDAGRLMVSSLQRACLLSEFKNNNGFQKVEMHDLIRDMALQIAGSRFMVKAGVGLKNFPNQEAWTEGVEVVSLMKNEFSETQISPRCSRLSILLLQHSQRFQGFPNPFFEHLVGLTVLNLSGSRIKSLPDSISYLKNLTVLLLKACVVLKYIPSLAELTTLRRLHLGGTGITRLPEGMEKLINLRYLNLSNTRHLKMLPMKLLCKLVNLQCLKVNWDSSTALKVNVQELMSLKKLETFYGGLCDIDDLNKYVNHKEKRGLPANYILLVGLDDLCSPRFDKHYDQCVVLFKCSTITTMNILELPNDVQGLWIEECHDIYSLCAVLIKTINLKEVHIKSCKGMKHVLTFPSYLCNNLRISAATFSQLKKFECYGCPKVKELFSPSLLPYLQSLEQIMIWKCNELEDIIESPPGENEEEYEYKKEGQGTNFFALPNLKTFELQYLPRLKRICGGKTRIRCASLRSLHVEDCPNLKRIPFSFSSQLLNEKQASPSSSSSLPPIKFELGICDMKWWNSLEWDHPDDKVMFRPFV